MEEGKLCEVRMRLESEDKNMKSWRQSETEQVKITKLFDMGWNKRNSGNRYDSLSLVILLWLFTILKLLLLELLQ